MGDEFYTSEHRPPVRQPKPGELLFESYAERTKKFYRCELRDHGKWGIEAQFFEGEHAFHTHMFRDTADGDRIISARQLAIRWATETRAVIEKGTL